MTTDKPEVNVDSLLKWIRCPMKVYYERRSVQKRFDHDSFLRFMLINTLGYKYSSIKSENELNLRKDIGDIWAHVLNQYGFPDISVKMRQLNEFYSKRKNLLESLKDRSRRYNDLINLSHWWDIGNDRPGADSDYYKLRDAINSDQHLLGFPEINIVKSYFREYNSLPVTLADTYADFMDAVEIFQTKSIPARNIRLDVPVSLSLNDVTLVLNIDIVWHRDKVYHDDKNRDLKPGTVADQFIYLSQLEDRKYLFDVMQIMNDLRNPLIGVAYTDQTNGEQIKFDSLCNTIVAGQFFSGAWTERDTRYDKNAIAQILDKYNQYAKTYYRSLISNCAIPKIAGGINSECAGCSWLSNCFSYGKVTASSPETYISDAEEDAADEFLEKFENRAQICDNRIDAMELVSFAIEYLKNNNNLNTFEKIGKTVANLRSDFLIERNLHRNARSKT
ncbi:MAG: hypothetical protein IJI14_16050 [Anaerolineaceae bacterium]|nr:hypothetical protein [Anaerolineaceae bacterium]